MLVVRSLPRRKELLLLLLLFSGKLPLPQSKAKKRIRFSSSDDASLHALRRASFSAWDIGLSTDEDGGALESDDGGFAGEPPAAAAVMFGAVSFVVFVCGISEVVVVELGLFRTVFASVVASVSWPAFSDEQLPAKELAWL